MKTPKYVRIQNTIVTSKLMIVQNKIDARKNNKHTTINHKNKNKTKNTTSQMFVIKKLVIRKSLKNTNMQ